MFFETLLLIVGLIIAIAGIIGCIIPALPGPPLNFIALIFVELLNDSIFSAKLLIIYLLLTILITVLDYILPSIGSKAFGVSKYGVWGSFAGMIIGMIFFPPFGMILGIIIGAITGELLAGKSNSEALKAGWATFAISIFMIVAKLSLSLLMTYHFVKGAFSILF